MSEHSRLGNNSQQDPGKLKDPSQPRKSAKPKNSNKELFTESNGKPPSKDDLQSEGSKNENKGSHKQTKPKQQAQDTVTNPASGVAYKRISKQTLLQFYPKAAHLQKLEAMLLDTQAFVKDKQLPVNEEPIDFDPNDAIMEKSTYQPATNQSNNSSTPAQQGGSLVNKNKDSNASNTTPQEVKPEEQFSFAKGFDPIKGFYFFSKCKFSNGIFV